MIEKKITFLDSEFVKEYSKFVAKNIFPDESKIFLNLSLSRQTAGGPINDFSNESIVKLGNHI